MCSSSWSKLVFCQLQLVLNEPVLTGKSWSFSKRQPERTSCFQLSLVFGKFGKCTTSCSCSSPNLGSKTGLNQTCKHYSGATDNFLNPCLIKHLRLGMRPLECPRKIWNIDGTNNQAGMLTHYVNLEVCTGPKEEKMQFLVTGLRNKELILGYPWLSMFEPQFNCASGAIDT
jgi:hypothetical protein